MVDEAVVQSDAHLTPQVPSGVLNQLALLVADLLLEQYNWLIWLAPIACTIYLVSLTISAVAGVLLN